MIEASIPQERSLAIPESRKPLTIASVITATLPAFIADPTLGRARSQLASLKAEELQVKQQLPSQVEQARIQLKQTNRALTQARARAENTERYYLKLGGLASFAYGILPQVIAERIIPLETDNATFEARKAEKANRERQLEEIYQNARYKQQRLEADTRTASRELDQATRTWVLADRERVLSYALSTMPNHAKPRESLFIEFAKQYGQDAEAVYYELAADYQKLTGQVELKRPLANSPSINEQTPIKDRSNSTSKMNGTNHSEHQDREVIMGSEKEIIYPFGIKTRKNQIFDGVRGYTDEEFARIVEDQQKKVAKEDPIKGAAIPYLLDYLRRNPLGPGTKPMRRHRERIGPHQLTIRSLDPAGVNGTSLTRNQAAHLRITYIFYNKNGHPVILLKGVYTSHQKYTEDNAHT